MDVCCATFHFCTNALTGLFQILCWFAYAWRKKQSSPRTREKLRLKWGSQTMGLQNLEAPLMTRHPHRVIHRVGVLMREKQWRVSPCDAEKWLPFMTKAASPPASAFSCKGLLSQSLRPPPPRCLTIPERARNIKTRLLERRWMM